MSHPPETSQELTDEIYNALAAVREGIDARQAIVALIDAWVRERKRESVVIALAAVLTQLTSGPYCRHDSREIVERALATARKQLETP